MTIAFLATGDELIHGDTLNTNSQKIANILCSEGLSLGLHLTCSDKENDLVQSMDYLAKNHSIIIITGGLGPTTDDRTRFALAKHLNVDLIKHEEATTHIHSRLSQVHAEYTQSNAQQALFPQKAILLPNPNGTAMGCIVSTKTHTYILLPGPPRECLPMFENHALVSLIDEKRSTKEILRWRLYGVAESEIASTFELALKGSGFSTGYRLDTPYVELKVRFPEGKANEVRAKIEPLIKAFIISPTDKSASLQLKEYLDLSTKPFCIKDKVSGGILQSLIQTPQNKHIVHFDTDVDCEVRFTLLGLKEYWAGQTAANGKSTVTIEYQNANIEGSESHLIPCRKTMPKHYAAEWLSFRLFHLLQKLH